MLSNAAAGSEGVTEYPTIGSRDDVGQRRVCDQRSLEL